VLPTPTNILDYIFQGTDSIQVFLNAYSYCQAHEHRASLLLVEDDHATTYYGKSKELQARLKTGASVADLRNNLGNTDGNGVLIETFALLSALAIHIAETQKTAISTSIEPYANSAGDRYWLGLNKPPLGGRIPHARRTPLELHWMLAECHKRLTVAPAETRAGRLTRIKLDKVLERFCEKRIARSGFRLAVSPLSYQAEIEGKSRRRPQEEYPYAFHLTSVEPIEEQIAALTAVLERASNEGASLLVLPELRMPPQLLEATKNFLRNQHTDEEHGLLMVVAGSWHVEMESRGFVNRCVILNYRGAELWTHDKLRPYVITAENFRTNPDFFRPIGVEEGGGHEDIHRGAKLEFYDSVIGRLAVAICVGFFSPDIEPLLKASHANLFLVPAMSPSTSDMEVVAKNLARSQSAVTLVANCGKVGRLGKDKGLSFYQLPSRGGKPESLPNNEVILYYVLP
jgi:predicted amidohydrolase